MHVYVIKMIKMLSFPILFLMITGIVTAQETKVDTSAASSVKVAKSGNNGDSEEMVLDVIEIKGHVEKPGVTIIPKRIEPEMEEKDINRSFDDEVKKGVGEILTPDEALREVDRVKSIKKTLEKKRK